MSATNQSLIEVTKQGDLGRVLELLISGADVHSVDEGLQTSLHWAASRGYSEICRLLIDRGVNVNACDSSGRTALHHSAWAGTTSACLLLVERGANVNALSLDHCTPLDLAGSCLNEQTCLALISNGSTVTKPIEEYNQKIRRIMGLSALQAGVEFGNSAVLLRLLNEDNDPETCEHRILQAVHLSQAQGQKEGPSIAMSWWTARLARQSIDAACSQAFVMTP